FLNLQNIVDICWEANSLVGPGRGSGVGFLLLYILGITQINPLRENTETFSWRFLDPERVSVLDVDIDSESSRREDILNAFREYYGADRVANVITFGTEKAKSAIQTAARGLGIDVDTAQYLSSLVPSDRGMVRTLSQCMYGDEENGWAPVSQFVHEMINNFPELWEVASKIEGLVCRMGTHAGGVIFVDKPFTESTSLMRAPDGTLITAFDLHDCEDAGLIKYDILAVNALDKMHNTIDLLCDYGYAERKPTLKETYEDIIGIYNLEREDEKMWEMIWNHEITSLFQMEQQSGVQGIALTKPRSVDELAVLNSVIRLMPQEKGAELPLNKFARFKNNINLWYQEMREHGLTQKEMELLEPILKISYGICESQEKFMQLVQLPELGGFSIGWADKLRKAVAKKEPAAFEALTEEFFERIKEKGLSINLAKYVWNVLIATSRGYGFNASHTLAYSLIALQQMNLAFRYPTIFWNTACLISDSGGDESDEEREEEEEEWVEEEYDDNIEDFAPEEDDEDEDEDEDGAGAKKEKKKKKRRATDYGKIAAAIGRMKSKGIQVAPPDINKSTYTFSPDVENSVIRYGMSGLTRVGEGLIQTIIEGRPYKSVEDFEKRVKINRLQMLSLLKAGAFDSFGERTELLKNYIRKISEPKKRVTLQNLRMLIEFGLIPEEYDMQSKVFNFNRYLKKHKLGTYYEIDKIAFDFYEKHFDMDHLEPEGENFKIKQSTWDSIYQSHMDIIRPFVRKNSEKLLEAINNRLMKDTWDKYCLGGISKWEMDSASCYFHDHELEHVDAAQYNCVDYASLPETPEIERIIYIRGKRVALQKITRIMGTVLDRDKSKRLVTLLTTSGVVTVKIYGDAFTHYDRQISEKLPTGKKRIVERSWFTRGNKVIITGVRRGDNFIAKKYKTTPYPLVELITEVGEDNKLVIQSARAEVV
ncbi:MAG TPA: DNA polymerase III subunit alpha, partial [Defluviitaleaceae bacterium]|nr:DNA polymerase III subunit alpha [Defluviitaleaceae bacterium]